MSIRIWIDELLDSDSALFPLLTTKNYCHNFFNDQPNLIAKT
jgi:hypothetical protein